MQVDIDCDCVHIAVNLEDNEDTIDAHDIL